MKDRSMLRRATLLGVLALEPALAAPAHASGEEVRAFWEGEPLFSGKDPAPAIGRTGLATAGPGNAAFDEFILQAASEK